MINISKSDLSTNRIANKMSKTHLIHLVGFFDDTVNFWNYFPLLGENILAYLFKKFQPNKWLGLIAYSQINE